MEDKIEKKKKELVELLRPYLSKYDREMLNDFFAYWTEPGRSGKKLRIDGQKYFDISRRLATWYRNSKSKYDSKQSSAKNTSTADALRAVLEINKPDNSATQG